jgi:adenylylsulfate kinase-like enzyme
LTRHQDPTRGNHSHQRERDFARSLVPAGRFFEIHVSCALEICRRRDPKGLYRRALEGEIREFTGVSSPYEAPVAPELLLETEIHSVEQCLERILERLRAEGIVT